MSVDKTPKNAGIRVRFKDLRLVRLGDISIIANITQKSITSSYIKSIDFLGKVCYNGSIGGDFWRALSSGIVFCLGGSMQKSIPFLYLSKWFGKSNLWEFKAAWQP